MTKRIRKVKWIIIFFTAPALILYTGFLAIPIINSIRLSFYTGTLFHVTEFVGLANYIKLFTVSPFKDRLFGAFLNNIIFFTILCFTQVVVSLILAIILTRKFKGSEFFRTFFFIPSLFSVLAVGFLFNLMLNPAWGIFDKILKIIGLGFLIRPWLGDSQTALPVMALVSSWQYLGIHMILFTSGIKGIDKEIFEAAKTDGVTPVGLARYIILPLLKPLIGIIIALVFISSFVMFDIVYAMSTTMGNPDYSTDLFASFFYRTLFGSSLMHFNPDMGLGAAIATIMFLIVITGVISWLTFFRKRKI